MEAKIDREDYWFNRLSTDKDGNPTPKRGQDVTLPAVRILVQGKTTAVLGVKKLKRENPTLPKRILLDLKAEAWDEHQRRMDAATIKVTKKAKS